jgi:hypothetical protein
MLHVAQLILLLRTFILDKYLSRSELEDRLARWTTDTCLTKLDLLVNFFPHWSHWAEEQGKAAAAAPWLTTWCLLRLSALLNPLPQDSQVKVGGRCTKEWRRKSFLLENVLKQMVQDIGSLCISI